MADSTLSIRQQLEDQLRTARKQRDEATKNIIAMLKNKMLMELKSGSGRVENDELWLELIQSYAKQVQKAIEEFEKAGERGKEHLEEARFELAFCQGFLPQKLSLEQTTELVRQIAEEQKITDKKQVGRLVGLVIKQHREQVDANLVRQAAESLLS